MSDEDAVRKGLAEIGLGEYVERFIEEGFDTWATVKSVTESDLDFLQVRLGHRRKLQSAIAESNNQHTPTLETDGCNDSSRSDLNRTASQANEPRTKRKYVRHPKPDRSAPVRPLSAYVLFAHHVRDATKDQGLTFTDMAKTVGARWQALPHDERQVFERRAATNKEKYNAELAEYKKSDKYTEYQQYLEIFRQEQENKKTRQLSNEAANPRLTDRVHPYRRSGSREDSPTHQDTRGDPNRVVDSPSPESTTSTSIVPPLRTLAPNDATSPAGYLRNTRGSREPRALPATSTASMSPPVSRRISNGSFAPPATAPSGGLSYATGPPQALGQTSSSSRHASDRHGSSALEAFAARHLPPPVTSGPSREGLAMHYGAPRPSSSGPSPNDCNNPGAAYSANPGTAHSYRTPHDHEAGLPPLRELTSEQARDLRSERSEPRGTVKSPFSGRMVDGEMTPPPRPAEAQKSDTIEGHRKDATKQTDLGPTPRTIEAIFDPVGPSLYPQQRLSELRSGPQRFGRDTPN